jgi:deazaflavin-dependent oxidoreductase (nitroreductase family)
MWRTVVRFVAGLSVVLAAIGVLIVVGMRRKWPPVLDTVRRANRRTKPLVLASAGTEGAYASVVKHVGRASGRSYETPVVVAATEDGFVIALPYGSNTDWLKNVCAKGSATVVTGGHTYEVDRPEVVPIEEATAYFRMTEQRMHRQFGVADCLRVRRAVEPGTRTTSEEAETETV